MTALDRAAAAVEAALGPSDTICIPPRDIARAVLEAIREPSEGMSNAGMDADDHIEFNNHGRIWQAMIDAALAEGAR